MYHTGFFKSLNIGALVVVVNFVGFAADNRWKHLLTVLHLGDLFQRPEVSERSFVIHLKQIYNEGHFHSGKMIFQAYT